MRTPVGKECRFYYQDFHRGRSIQECRLLTQGANSLPWEPSVCAICSVPDILLANGCPHMTLSARLVRRWFRKRVEVQAYCTQHHIPVKDPYVGCGQCHPAAAAILGEKR